jgi:hypothetical protein
MNSCDDCHASTADLFSRRCVECHKTVCSDCALICSNEKSYFGEPCENHMCYDCEQKYGGFCWQCEAWRPPKPKKQRRPIYVPPFHMVLRSATRRAAKLTGVAAPSAGAGTTDD